MVACAGDFCTGVRDVWLAFLGRRGSGADQVLTRCCRGAVAQILRKARPAAAAAARGRRLTRVLLVVRLGLTGMGCVAHRRPRTFGVT